MKKIELSNTDVVVYAIFKLGGAEKKIHTERIAMECFKLSKERFCWRLPEYREYPDKEITRLTLKNLSKSKNSKFGQLVTGRSGVEASGKETDGWMLTPQGVQWILKNQTKIEKVINTEIIPAKRPDVQRILRKFGEEKCYRMFQRYGHLKQVTEYDFKDMLRCSPDAHVETIRKEFEKLKTHGQITQDKTILSFLEACEKTFKHVMYTRKE